MIIIEFDQNPYLKQKSELKDSIQTSFIRVLIYAIDV